MIRDGATRSGFTQMRQSIRFDTIFLPSGNGQSVGSDWLKCASFDEMKADEYRYWQSRAVHERVQAVSVLTQIPPFAKEAKDGAPGKTAEV